MTFPQRILEWWTELIAAFQFLTRVPLPAIAYTPNTLAGALKFFPFVGLTIGCCAAVLYPWLLHHLGNAMAALLVLLFLVAITGCLHEDGLADTADGLLGGSTLEKRLAIMRDSRIGTYGAAALFFSIGARWILLASLPPERFTAYAVCASALSRWTVLPLSAVLRPAQAEGQGARVAGKTSAGTLFTGSLIASVAVLYLLRQYALEPVVAVIVTTVISGLVYAKKIGGITGDCYGATIQLSEIAVYLCGVWHR
ncbi:adenosylcobinamide-GDP ribazoletransferase [Silvibacterium acidisoli]|uniref:adenosylcobinamide-GDP ribazoletransferase n=1 Tax=Acidobacteriaceae bacterium ZG23-2 TaxID=2883246 RepID=UPI00406C4341